MTFSGFHVPTSWQHWSYTLACAFIGAAAGAWQGHNWHEAVLAGGIAVAGFLKTFPLPAAPGAKE